MLNRLCKDDFPVQMEGVKFAVDKILRIHFQVVHTVHVSALAFLGYLLHVVYADTWNYGQ